MFHNPNVKNISYLHIYYETSVPKSSTYLIIEIKSLKLFLLAFDHGDGRN